MIDITFILKPHRTRQAISSLIEFDRDSRCSVILDHVTCLADNSPRIIEMTNKGCDRTRARDNSSAIDRTRGKKDSKEEAVYNERDYGVRSRFIEHYRFPVGWEEYTDSSILIEMGLTFTTVTDGSPAVGNRRQVAISRKTAKYVH